ncbi:GPW/gp25 family protein [Pelotomaculum terephthalicicum JT]|uniref:GPW/gp25 family protein n=1 Tax=Pelotomaculum TaxID=191373 RepID=UPI0009C69B40|nr:MULTISPECIES: GPW/gp25 family protein [Pelotomaculum]MCG9967139.1 GPW/gp25 family protein [Pelotomaculum terephthalicicum JT]OPX90388.1 MAG: Gene 25-like lysozyme [Pelotomaculum sp. PtaB.Bin117]
MSEDICGFSFPFRIDSSGRVAQTSGPEKLKENIKHILLTGIGERVMRRDYGGGLRQLVHDPNNDALRAIVQHQIAKSIGQWEPRVQVQGVTVTQKDGMFSIEILYVIGHTQQLQSLSVPIGLGGI